MVASRRFWVWIIVGALVLLALLSLTRGPLRRPEPVPPVPGQQTPIQPAPGEAPGAPDVVPGAPAPGEQLQPGLPVPGERMPVAPGSDNR